MKNNQFKGTTGKWYVRKETGHEVWVEGGLRVAEVWAASRRSWEDMSNPANKIEEEANARLIAAAPELLDALLELLHLHACDAEGIECGLPTAEQWFAAENKAEAAINKALGNE